MHLVVLLVRSLSAVFVGMLILTNAFAAVLEAVADVVFTSEITLGAVLLFLAHGLGLDSGVVVGVHLCRHMV